MQRFADWFSPESVEVPEYTLIYERCRIARARAPTEDGDVITERILEAFLTHAAGMLGRHDLQEALVSAAAPSRYRRCS